MRLGVIGLSSYFRRAYVPYLKTRAQVELRAVCDVLPEEVLRKMIMEAGLEAAPVFFSDVQSMLSSVQMDAVVISTPHIFHFEQARACLRAGMHVFLDKPLACRYEEAQTLVRMAEEANLRLAVGAQRRYERPYEYVRGTVQNGVLGEIHAVNYLFANSPWYDYSRSWRGDPTLNGGGALIDIGYLAIDMVVWLLAQPLGRVYGVSPRMERGHAEKSIGILAVFGSDILVNFLITYEAPAPSIQEELSIYGSAGCIFTRRLQSKRSSEPPHVIEQSTENGERRVEFADLPDSSRPFDDFLKGIETRAPVRCDGVSALPTHELIQKASDWIQTPNKTVLA